MGIVEELSDKMDKVMTAIEQEDFWKFLLAPNTSLQQIETVLSEVFLRIWWYQPQASEAGFHMLGRFPKSETRLLKSLLMHKAEEGIHGEWALRDYLLLGGDREKIGTPSPSCFAVVATWWLMAQKEDPMGYLGAEFLFEELTARVCQPLIPLFKTKGVDLTKIGFIVEHATEDIKHSNLLRYCAEELHSRHPQSRDSMLRCFDYFNQVYPVPVWREAYAAFVSEL